MHQHKILTYIYFFCFIEDEQVPKQVGGGSGTHWAANDGSTRKWPRDAEGDWKMFLVICCYSFELKNSNPIFENWNAWCGRSRGGRGSREPNTCTYSGQLHKMNCVNISTYIYSVNCRIEEDQVPKQVGGRPRRNRKTWKRSEEWNKYAKIIRTRVSVRALVQ